jgi:hypothetical protein
MPTKLFYSQEEQLASNAIAQNENKPVKDKKSH